MVLQWLKVKVVSGYGQTKERKNDIQKDEQNIASLSISLSLSHTHNVHSDITIT